MDREVRRATAFIGTSGRAVLTPPRRTRVKRRLRASDVLSAAGSLGGVGEGAGVALLQKLKNMITIPRFPRLLALSSVMERVSVVVGEQLTWNPLFKLVTLFAFSAVFVLVGAAMFRNFDRDREEIDSPLWRALRAVANPYEDDFKSGPLRVISTLCALGGMVFFGLLCGIVTDSVDASMGALSRGKTPCFASDHVLMLGWNSNSTHVLRAVAASNVAGGKGKARTTVVMSQRSPELIREKIEEEVPDAERKKVRVLLRTGSALLREDVERVAAHQAHTLVVVNDEAVTEDDAAKEDDDSSSKITLGDDVSSPVLAKLLALRQLLPEFSGNIVAETGSQRDAHLAETFFRSTKVKRVDAVSSEQLRGRFLVQALQQPRLTSVITQLLEGNDSRAFHVMRVADLDPRAAGKSLADFDIYSNPSAIVVGYIDAVTRQTILEPNAKNLVLSADTELIVLGKPSQDIASVAQSNPTGIGKRTASNGGVKNAMRHIRRQSILICGWREYMDDMLIELDTSVAHGSQVVVVADSSYGYSMNKEELRALEKKLRNISLSITDAPPDDMQVLAKAFERQTFNRVVIMPPSIRAQTTPSTEADARSLTILAYLNCLVRGADESRGAFLSDTKPPSITVEFLNERFAALEWENAADVDNVIMPRAVAARLSAEAVRDGRLCALWNQLLSQEGREIYIRPVSSYAPALSVPDNVAISAAFQTLGRKLREASGDILIGAIETQREKGATSKRLPSTITINPAGAARNTERIWDVDDMVIVLGRS